MIDLETPAHPVHVLDGVPVEFRPDAPYDLRTGERWHAYRFRDRRKDPTFVFIDEEPCVDR